MDQLMMSDIRESSQKAKLDRLEVMTRLCAVSTDADERDRYSVMIARLQAEILQTDLAGSGTPASGNS